MVGDWFVSVAWLDFVKGIIFAGVFQAVRTALPGKGAAKGLTYGLLIFFLLGRRRGFGSA